MNHDLLALLRLVGFVIVGLGIFMLGREQTVTVRQGRPARPWFIALWVALVPIGAAVDILAILAG